jgi:DNA helicase HerA-like ATPase
MPEVGDPEKPHLVFFFDEAHLLFEDAPKALVDKVEQVVRLIRSKGVGVYFISQSPLDVPEDVLGQLGNRVQHALRAFTSKDQKVIKATAETFRRNPALNAETALTELGVGEALVSTLEGKGAPSMVERALIRPPSSRIGPATDTERKAVIDASPIRGRYDKPLDRESAYETLAQRAEKTVQEQPPAAPAPAPGRRQAEAPRRPLNRLTTAEVVMREVGRTVGREIIRGILGSIFKGRRR